MWLLLAACTSLADSPPLTPVATTTSFARALEAALSQLGGG